MSGSGRGTAPPELKESDCQVCGALVYARGKVPADYCQDAARRQSACQRLASYMRGAQALIGQVEFTSQRARQLRGQLWRLANQLNTQVRR